ncbi:MAG: hypothetical protein IKT09_04355 [Synergistes sp.]|nr:hypothetical protein [Synergistes sp.]
MKETPDRNRREEGFVLITVLLLTAVLFFAAGFALREAMNISDEKSETARRLRTENAAKQASAIADVWLRHQIRAAGSGYFSPDADPETDPLITIPESFFSELENIYPDHAFSCVTADLHYAPSFSSEAARLGMPLIPPRIPEEGGTTRYFMQKTSAAGTEHGTISSITKIISCTRDINGEISFRTENETF